MDTLFWTAFGMPFVLLSDFMALMALVVAILIALVTASQLVTGCRISRITRWWGAALVALMFGGAGLYFMIHNQHLYIRSVLGFSPLIIGLLLISAVLVLSLAVMIQNWRRT